MASQRRGAIRIAASAFPITPAPLLSTVAAPPDHTTAPLFVRPPVGVPSGGPRLAFLDGLRGLAAIWVLLFHLGAGGQIVTLLALLPAWLDIALIDWGYLGVAVFFVLSGFVIALSVGDTPVDGHYLRRFVMRRSIRLDLPYWASIAITLAVLTAKATLRPGAPTPRVGIGNLLAHMVYLQDLLGLPEINEVYWTLCFEIQFYLLFGALLLLSTWSSGDNRTSRARGIVFTGAALVALAWPLFPTLHLRGLSLTHWYGFLLGALVCWSLTGRMATRWLGLYVALLLGVWWKTREDFTMACILTAAVIHTVGTAGRLATALHGRLVQFLGRISYSLYLLHIPVSGGMFALTAQVLGDSVLDRAIATSAVFAANVCVAWLAWRFIEQPSTQLSRRLRLTPTAPG